MSEVAYPALWDATAAQTVPVAIQVRPAHQPSRQRLAAYVADLQSRDRETVRFALACFGLYGTMQHCKPVATVLRSTDPLLVHAAEEALWSIWMRGDASAEAVAELAEAMEEMGSGAEVSDTVVERLDRLSDQHPTFAEVHFQRGLAHHQLGRTDRAVAAFKRALTFNPLHFGAALALGAIFIEHNHWRSALRAYERAFRIFPSLEGVTEAIAAVRQHLDRETSYDGGAEFPA